MLLASLAVLLAPGLALALLFRVVERLERARDEARWRQVAVTDAIHAELGAIVAPTVLRQPRGVWQVRVAVPFERPAAVERVVAIAHRTLARLDPAGAARLRIVLEPQVRSTRATPVAPSAPRAGVRKEPARAVAG